MAHSFSVTYSDANPKTAAWYATSATGTYIIKVERHVDGIFNVVRTFQDSGSSGHIYNLVSKANYRFGLYSNGVWVYRTHTTR